MGTIKIVISEDCSFDVGPTVIREMMKHKNLTKYVDCYQEDSNFKREDAKTVKLDDEFCVRLSPYYSSDSDRSFIDGDLIRKGHIFCFYGMRDHSRSDTDFIELLEKLGIENCGTARSKLKIIEIPDDVDWDIGNSDYGGEWIFEKHRTWS